MDFLKIWTILPFCNFLTYWPTNQEWEASFFKFWDTEKPIVEVDRRYLINHYPHPTIVQFLEHVNFYSTLNAKYYYQQKRRTSIWEIMAVPWLKFIYTYFFKLGFLDGATGLVYSFMMSFHSFLTRAKLYQLNHDD